jgi:hypothetical protein
MWSLRFENLMDKLEPPKKEIRLGPSRVFSEQRESMQIWWCACVGCVSNYERAEKEGGISLESVRFSDRG